MTLQNFTDAKYRSLGSLTGIRGAASIWVVIYHFGQGIPGYSIIPSLYSYSFVSNGFRGVDLFFILSGFIMMHAHAKDFVHINLESIRRFAFLRAFRIYPVNFAALLLILAICAALPGYVEWFRSWTNEISLKSYTPLSFLQTATLSNRWFIPDFGLWNIVTWSLSVELLAYLLLPFLACSLLKIRSANLCLFISIASVLSMIAILLAFHNWNGDSVTRLGIVRGFGGFIAGAAMRHYVALAPDRNGAPGWVALASVAAVGVLLIFPNLGILMPLAFTFLIGALSYQRGIINATLSSRPLMFLGKISFSIYLVHYTPLAVLEWLFINNMLPNTNLSVTACVLLYMLAIFLLSIMLHYAVERPCQHMGRKFIGGPERRLQALESRR